MFIQEGCVGMVKVHSGMTQEPLVGGFVLVDVEVVQHDVKGAYGVGHHDVVLDTQKVHRGPPAGLAQMFRRLCCRSSCCATKLRLGSEKNTGKCRPDVGFLA